MQEATDNIVVLVAIATGGTFLMAGSFILIYIRNQQKVLKQRQQLQQAELAHQKELLFTVIESQEGERKRIGRDLHDDVGAAISSLRLIIQMFDPADSNFDHQQFIRSCKNIIDKMMTDVRNISHNLSPATLSYFGLWAAVEEQCAIINQSGKLEILLNNDALLLLEKITLPAATAIYRVIEEMINNTIKHAKADKVDIKFIAEDNMLIVKYADNGIGMERSSLNRGMGLQNIESRLTIINALYTIDTAPGNGFSLQINYPMTD